MQTMGWFGAVRGHSRSSAMLPFDRGHTTSYSTLIETMRLSCTVVEMQPVISQKSPILTHHPSHLHSVPSQGMTPVEFRGDLWHQKTRVPALSCGVVCVIVRLAVLVELRLVTDTGRHRPMASTADAQHRAVKTKAETQAEDHSVDKRTKSQRIFTARRYASAVCAVVACPSVRLSVCPSQAAIVSTRLHGQIEMAWELPLNQALS